MTAVQPEVGQELYDSEATSDDELGTSYGEKTPEFNLSDLDDKPEEKTPRAHHRRTKVDELITLVWGSVGMMLVRTETDVPVGRVLQFEAPLAGKKIDEIIAGTWLDSILQPFAKHADKVEGLGAVVLFPLLVGAYERNQSIGPMVEPILRQVVRSSLVEMAPILRKQEADTKKAAAAISDLNDVFELEEGVDPVDAVLSAIFAPKEAVIPDEE